MTENFRSIEVLVETPEMQAVLARPPIEPRYDMLSGRDFTRNTELFYRLADIIELFPEHYDQEQWSDTVGECGTSHCVAGWAAAEAGYQPDRWTSTNGFEVIEWAWVTRKSWEGYTAPIERVAGAELGLTSMESEWLFHAGMLPYPPCTTVPEVLRRAGDGERLTELCYSFPENFLGSDLDLEYERRGTVAITGIRPS